jgi:hypothetical protein
MRRFYGESEERTGGHLEYNSLRICSEQMTTVEPEGISIMATATITIQVEAEAAKAFAAASLEEQRKMQLLLSLRLQDLTMPQGKSLQAVMDEIGAHAAARGLTPELLESLLRDE